LAQLGVSCAAILLAAAKKGSNSSADGREADPHRDLGAAAALHRHPGPRPYALWEHTHEFEPDGEGACTMRDLVRYEVPYGPLGELAHRLFVRRDLERIFDFRRDALAAHFGPA
jgi:hypothetical protein